MSSKLLKILTVVGPALFIALFELSRHSLFVEDEPMFVGNLLLLGVVTVTAFFFSRFIFGVIERAQRENLRRNKELSALNSVALAVSESLNLEVVVRKAIDKVLELTAADAGEVFLWSDQVGEMVRWIHVGMLPEVFEQKTRFRPGEGFAGAVAFRDEPMLVQDISLEPSLNGDAIAKGGLRSAACVALRSKSNTLGAMCIYGMKPESFTRDDSRLLTSMSYQIALGIDNAHLQDEIRRMAAVEERERIAREMHDGIAQVLSYVSTKSQATRQFISTRQMEKAVVQLTQLEKAAHEVYRDVREAILNLRATVSAERNIVDTLQEYIMRFSQTSSVKTALEIDGNDILSLAPTAEVQVIRIIQEALTNVRKHADSKHARVHIHSVDDHLEISIEDYGRGFHVSSSRHDGWPRLGLQTMKERAESVHGNLEIASVPFKGTKVTLRVPAGRGL